MNSRKNIIILCSPTSDDFRNEMHRTKGMFFPPMGLLLVAQTLKNSGYDVKLFDGNYDFNYKNKILDFVLRNQENIVFVGFYLAFLQIKDFLEIVNNIRGVNKSIKIIAGGPFSSAFPNLVLKNGMVDACCIGEGAKVSAEVAQNIVDDRSLEGISNIVFESRDKFCPDKSRKRDTLNEHNRIFYENFLDVNSYADKFSLYLPRDYDKSIKRAMPILTGLGCSYKCAFCENALLGGSHISLSAENIVDQVSYYNDRFKIDSFAFFDEDFFIDKDRLFKLIELLRNRKMKIKWGTQCRANYFNEKYINKSLLKDLEESGCVRLSIGIESGSPEILKKINKGITPRQAILAAEQGKDSSIYFSYSFLVNLPGETKKDLYMSFRLIDKLLSIKKNSFVSAIHYYFAYPGTPLSIEA